MKLRGKMGDGLTWKFLLGNGIYALGFRFTDSKQFKMSVRLDFEQNRLLDDGLSSPRTLGFFQIWAGKLG